MRRVLAQLCSMLFVVGAAAVPRAATDAAAPASLTIVHLSDLHVSLRSAPTKTPWTHKIRIGGYKLHRKRLELTPALLAAAVRVVNTDIRPDLVVITGDIVDRGNDDAALAEAHRLIEGFSCPVIVVRGDHDPRPGSVAGAADAFRTFFGPADGVRVVKGYRFFFLPFNPPEAVLTRLRRGLEASGSDRLRFVCMHRMLHASPLMNRLSKKYCSSLLSPKRDALNAILAADGGAFVVLCGHSHTNYRRHKANVTHICTASLAEHPHHFRVIRVRDGKVRTEFVRLDLHQLAAVDEAAYHAPGK